MATGSLDNLNTNCLRAHNRWETNFVKVYGTGYNNAYIKFKETIKEQEDADKAAYEKKVAWALLAFSLCGGSILTHVFGSAALKEIAAKVAIDTIVNHSMERSFKVAAFVERNKTAQFLLGNLWDRGEGWVGDKLNAKITKETDKVKTTRQLEEFASNYAGLRTFGEDPLTVQNSLSIWVGQLFDIVLTAAKAIDEHFDGDKSGLFKALSSSLLITAAPTDNSVDETQVSEDIELTFYMKLILDSDYVRDFATDEEHKQAGRRFLPAVERPIKQSAFGVDYPMAPKDKLTPYVRGHVLEVGYRNVGDKIRGRVNQLHKAKFGSDFFEKKEKISRKTLGRAEITLNMLEGFNHNKILKTLTQIKM